MREEAEHAGHTEEFDQRFPKAAPDVYIFLLFCPFDLFLSFKSILESSVGLVEFASRKKKKNRERKLCCPLAASDLKEAGKRVGSRTGNFASYSDPQKRRVDGRHSPCDEFGNCAGI